VKVSALLRSALTFENCNPPFMYYPLSKDLGVLQTPHIDPPPFRPPSTLQLEKDD